MAASPSITHLTSVMRGTAGANRPLVTRCRVADRSATGMPGGAGARVRPTVIPSIGCTCGSCMGLQMYYIGESPRQKKYEVIGRRFALCPSDQLVVISHIGGAVPSQVSGPASAERAERIPTPAAHKTA